jgi:uncharacterized membrane protein
MHLVEGLIDHELLGIHYVYEYTGSKLPCDLAFPATGNPALLLAADTRRKKPARSQPATTPVNRFGCIIAR